MWWNGVLRVILSLLVRHKCREQASVAVGEKKLNAVFGYCTGSFEIELPSLSSLINVFRCIFNHNLCSDAPQCGCTYIKCFIGSVPIKSLMTTQLKMVSHKDQCHIVLNSNKRYLLQNT